MEDLGGNNLFYSKKITISGWWFYATNQFRTWSFLFYFTNNYVG